MAKKEEVSGHATRTGSPEKKEVPKEQSIKSAYIVSPELGDRILVMFGELPIKFSQMVTPLAEALSKSPRADVNLKLPEEEEK